LFYLPRSTHHRQSRRDFGSLMRLPRRTRRAGSNHQHIAASCEVWAWSYSSASSNNERDGDCLQLDHKPRKETSGSFLPLLQWLRSFLTFRLPAIP
jgi:hypothetical protein